MRASQLINRLQTLQLNHGDLEVFMDTNANGLIQIGEVDVDADDTGIMLWPFEAGLEEVT